MVRNIRLNFQDEYIAEKKVELNREKDKHDERYTRFSLVQVFAACQEESHLLFEHIVVTD